MIKLFVVLFSFIISTITSVSAYDVVGVGAPCMDLIVHVDDKFFENIEGKGSSTQIEWFELESMLHDAKHFPEALKAGGSCANTIRGLANLGEECCFNGKMGHDEMGKLFQQKLAEEGISFFPLYDIRHTQIVLSMITSDGDRTMRCYPGAANEMGSGELNPYIFQGARLVAVEAYMLYARDSHFVRSIMQLAKQSNATVSFDLSSYNLVSMKREMIQELIRDYVDILFANADEVRALTGLEPAEACLELQKQCEIVVIMIGKDGCLVGSKGKVIHSPATEAKVIDTTGAGDLFASGFLHGWLSGYSLEDCSWIGNLTGGAVCEVDGAEIPAEKWKEIKAKIKLLVNR